MHAITQSLGSGTVGMTNPPSDLALRLIWFWQSVISKRRRLPRASNERIHQHVRPALGGDYADSVLERSGHCRKYRHGIR